MQLILTHLLVFKLSLTLKQLLRYCKVSFTWLKIFCKQASVVGIGDGGLLGGNLG